MRSLHPPSLKHLQYQIYFSAELGITLLHLQIQKDRMLKQQSNGPWSSKLLTVIIFGCMLSWAVHSQSAEDDEVEVAIDGYNHRFYSGYLDISVIRNKKSIHYVFYESQSDISKDPLILWLSGGPACSSLLGSFHENGPFVFKPQQSQFELNEYAWNKNANLLYLQLPAGVGFSQIQNFEEMNDQIFTQEAIQAMRLFMTRFQRMKKNDLYLTGHAYGGVYITHLAKQMLDENADPFSVFNDKWNLKGIMVGNPCTKPNECYTSGIVKNSPYHYEFLYKRGFFADKYYREYLTQCSFNYESYECFAERQKLDKQFNDTNTSTLNIYDKCYRGSNNSESGFSYINTGCEDEAGLINYLNENLTKYNWNILPEDWDRQWMPCNGTIHEAYLSGNNSYHLYPGLVKSGIKVWVYSGDVDSHIPITGTKKWINQLRGDLQMAVKKNWREWWVPGRHKGEDQVGGFVWELEGLTFASIKGSGLRVGLDKPEATKEVLDAFLSGKELPYKS